jgi:uncharacterized protein
VDPILHLSLPVAELPVARRFYLEVLGCSAGRQNSTAADVWFLGMQLTLQQLPDQVLAEQGSRHFGATLARDHWDVLCARVEEHGVPWLRPPLTRHEGTPQEERKAYLADPSGNVIELKSYADLDATLRSTAGSYA